MPPVQRHETSERRCWPEHVSNTTRVGDGLASHVCALADGPATMGAAFKTEGVREEVVLLDGARRGMISVGA
jgi:hypothetical protein